MRFSDHYKETLQAYIDVLMLEFTVKDFSKNVPSKRNRVWLKKRQEDGVTGSFFKDVIWNNAKNTLLLKYKTNPTPTEPIQKVSKKGDISNTKIYDIEIKFEGVQQYLGTKKEYKDLTKGTQIKRVRDMVKNATVRVHSNAPDFLWQGGWMRARENDYNIYPIPAKRNKDKGIWKARHAGKNEYITKHLLEVVKTIPFVADEIAKTISDKYK